MLFNPFPQNIEWGFPPFVPTLTIYQQKQFDSNAGCATYQFESTHNTGFLAASLVSRVHQLLYTISKEARCTKVCMNTHFGPKQSWRVTEELV